MKSNENFSFFSFSFPSNFYAAKQNLNNQKIYIYIYIYQKYVQFICNRIWNCNLSKRYYNNKKLKITWNQKNTFFILSFSFPSNFYAAKQNLKNQKKSKLTTQLNYENFDYYTHTTTCYARNIDNFQFFYDSKTVPFLLKIVRKMELMDLHCCFSGEQSGPLVVKSDGGWSISRREREREREREILGSERSVRF